MRIVPQFTDTHHASYTLAAPPAHCESFLNASHLCRNASARERHSLRSLFVVSPGVSVCETDIQHAHRVGHITGNKVPECLTTHDISFYTESGWMFIRGTKAIECKHHTENTDVATLRVCAQHCFDKARDTSPQLVVILDVPEALRSTVRQIYTDALRDWTASNAVHLHVTFLFTDVFFGSFKR